jgi:hypothetical protein
VVLGILGRMNPLRLHLVAAGSVVALAVGCGSSSPTGTPSTSTGATGTQALSTGAGALVAEARATAAGDIPDNQVFLTHRSGRPPYSIKYPEGWAVSAQGSTTVIRDKNNLIRIVASAGASPTAATVAADLARLRAQTPSLRTGTPSTSPTCAIRGQTRAVPAAAVRVDYSTLSPPDPVTGKRVKLLVNRYYLYHAGHVVTVDLGTPQGVDNVDAYCLMIGSFRWR